MQIRPFSAVASPQHGVDEATSAREAMLEMSVQHAQQLTYVKEVYERRITALRQQKQALVKNVKNGHHRTLTNQLMWGEHRANFLNNRHPQRGKRSFGALGQSLVYMNCMISLRDRREVASFLLEVACGISLVGLFSKGRFTSKYRAPSQFARKWTDGSPSCRRKLLLRRLRLGYKSAFLVPTHDLPA